MNRAINAMRIFHSELSGHPVEWIFLNFILTKQIHKLCKNYIDYEFEHFFIILTILLIAIRIYR